jgi:hypothetical protein
MDWIEKLKSRWGLTTLWQVTLVLIVFACTGFTVLFIKEPLIEWIRGDAEKQWWMTLLYFVLILPIYNILLLAFGFVFGQFKFFWSYEKKTLGRLIRLFKSRPE